MPINTTDIPTENITDVDMTFNTTAISRDAGSTWFNGTTTNDANIDLRDEHGVSSDYTNTSLTIDDTTGYDNVTINSAIDWNAGNYTNTSLDGDTLELNSSHSFGYWHSPIYSLDNSSGVAINRTIFSHLVNGTGTVKIRENTGDAWSNITPDDTYEQFQINVSLSGGDNTWSMDELTYGTGYIDAISFSPDGNYLAHTRTAGDDIYIHNTSTWSVVETLSNASSRRYSLSWSPDGNYLASGSWDDVHIFNTSTWYLDETLTDAYEEVRTLSWSPDGNYLASGSDNDNVYIYDTSTWSLDETLTDATNNVYSVSWSPDGNYLASGSFDNNVYIYDTSTWLVDETLTNPSYVMSVDWSPDGNYLASGSINDDVYIYDTSTWSVDETLTDATDRVYSVSWSPDGNYLASGSWDNNVYIYDTSTWSLDETLTDATDDVLSLDWSPDGNYLAVGWASDDAEVHLYSVPTGDEYVNSINIAFKDTSDVLINGDAYTVDGTLYLNTSTDWSHFNLTTKYGTTDYSYNINVHYPLSALSETSIYVTLINNASVVLHEFNQTLETSTNYSFSFSGEDYTNITYAYYQSDTNTTVNLNSNVTLTYLTYTYSTVNPLFQIFTDLGFYAILISTVVCIVFAIITKSLIAPVLLFLFSMTIFLWAGWINPLIPIVCYFAFGGYYLLISTNRGKKL